FFIDRDNLLFERNFYLAAVCIGLAIGTKVIGVFFFLAIPAYLLVGFFSEKITWKQLIARALIFLGIMVATIIIINPFLFFPSQFARMIRILSGQSAAMSKGWTLFYPKGPSSWLFIIENLYGQLIFIALALFALGLGIWKSNNRVHHLMIAMWAIPFGIYVLYTIAIKPTHFFLPILLPVYSSIIVLFEFPTLFKGEKIRPVRWVWSGLALLIILSQFAIYIKKDLELYQNVLVREDHEESLNFYNILKNNYLQRIQSDEKLVVYRDVRMYFPDGPQWIIRSSWNSSYTDINQIKPEIIIIWRQRILDYTREGAQENAVDPETFQSIYQFYVDADRDHLDGYHLIYRDNEGLFFVNEALYDEYFQ
ncbi:MAG TPA: hypothetical protein VJ987_12685, partial [Anaerolineales bacterium]|nr:hypothetical protein [Anaerolineales bacterium]